MTDHILQNRWYLNFLILAILTRLLIMPFFFHPDIKTYHFQASFLQKGIIDIYSYLPAHGGELPLKEEFVYFPLTYFTLGVYQIMALPFLGPDFLQWLSNASASALEMIGVFRYLFILKLPYLILDLLIAFILTKLVSEEANKRKVFLLWLFNPFSIIILYVFSNVDIFPVFLSVLSLLFVKKNNFLMAGLMLGLGAGFKAYPLLFVPFIFFAASKLKDKIWVLITSILPFLIIIAPFLKSSGFQQATLNSGLTTRIISNGIPIGFGEMIYPGLVLLAAIFFLGWQKNYSLFTLSAYCFSVILAIFMNIHFHIQWLIWPMPFIVLILAYQRKWLWPFVLLGSLALSIPLLYNDSSMTVATLSVINPLFSNLPTPYKIVQHFYDPVILESVLHSILFGTGLLVIYQMLREKKEV